MGTDVPFFVYGTLLPDQPNAPLWDGQVVSQAAAVLENGRLYDMGHFPMMIAEAGSTVQGMVLTIQPDAYQDVLAKLDELEGYTPDDPQSCAYQRVCIEVRLKNGRKVQAWVYQGQPQFVVGRPPIPHGDWATYAASKSQEIDGWWTNIDTVHGLL